ncbi:MAG: hypothetical protein ABJC74_05500 [Gemmatimonadota bacterium]
MGGTIAVLIVAFVIYSKIRDGLKRAGMPGGGRGGDDSRRSPSAGGTSGEVFSLQQVLAEIQKVKQQSQQGQSAGRKPATFNQARSSVLNSLKQTGLAERAAARRYAIAQVPTRESRPLVRVSEPVTVVTEPDEPPVAVSSTAAPLELVDVNAATPGVAAPAPRFTAAQLRDAVIWREILSPPVSMRDE